MGKTFLFFLLSLLVCFGCSSDDLQDVKPTELETKSSSESYCWWNSSDLFGASYSGVGEDYMATMKISKYGSLSNQINVLYNNCSGKATVRYKDSNGSSLPGGGFSFSFDGDKFTYSCDSNNEGSERWFEITLLPPFGASLAPASPTRIRFVQAYN